MSPKKTDIERLLAETKKAFGQLDILVNNAGVYEFAPLENITEEHFHRHFNLNVLGLLLTTQEAVKLIGSGGGSVINISSIVSTAALPGSSVYASTKASVDAITRVLAGELGTRKIRVNAINPGMVDTEGAKDFTQSDFRKQVESQTPLGRIGVPADIASAAVFFATEDSSWISGETLKIGGGYR